MTAASTGTGSLRIYFKAGTRLRAGGLWARWTAPALGVHLLREAKKAGIRQAMLYSVPPAEEGAPYPGGYHPGAPQCAELVDDISKLDAFLGAQCACLRDARTVLLNSEELVQR